MELAKAHSASKERQVAWMLSDRVIALLRVWAASVSVTVFDIECLNGLMRRILSTNGRQADFATEAAKILLKESV